MVIQVSNALYIQLSLVSLDPKPLNPKSLNPKDPGAEMCCVAGCGILPQTIARPRLKCMEHLVQL